MRAPAAKKPSASPARNCKYYSKVDLVKAAWSWCPTGEQLEAIFYSLKKSRPPARGRSSPPAKQTSLLAASEKPMVAPRTYTKSEMVAIRLRMENALLREARAADAAVIATLRARLAEAERAAAATAPAAEKTKERIPVHPPLKCDSRVDMATDPNPPTKFIHDKWCARRDELLKLGTNAKGARFMLLRIALAMNLAQEYYGNLASVVGHQCGRLLSERVVYFLLGGKSTGWEDTLNARIKRLEDDCVYGKDALRYGGAADPNLGVVDDLKALKDYGNRVDHEELDDVLPEEKPDIVHRAFRVASRVLEIAKQP